MRLDHLQRELNHIIRDLPATMAWRNRLISVARDNLSQGGSLNEFGENLTFDTMVHVAVSEFADGIRPKRNDVLEVDGVRMKIIDTTLSPDELLLTLNLVRQRG